MSRFLLSFFLILALASSFGLASAAWAADPPAGDRCFCERELRLARDDDNLQNASEWYADCLSYNSIDTCNLQEINRQRDKNYTRCYLKRNADECRTAMRAWEDERNRKMAARTLQTEDPSSGILARAIPRCLLNDEFKPECREIGKFVALLINFGRGIFGIIGTFALAYFIYGGFVLIMSQGNPEKIKKGGEIMVAAVIGLVIIFSAYALMHFLGNAVGLKTNDYQLQ